MNNLKKRLNSPAYFAMIITFIFGIAVHLFGLLNTMHNHDDINNQPAGYGTGVESGRWLLTILGKLAQQITGNYTLTWFNGVLFIAFLAVSVGFVVATFKLKSLKLGALIGMIFVVFPTATCTLLFRYTAPYYGLAILFAVLAVWVIGKIRFAFFISAALTAMSLGIYQGYLPLTASLFVLLLLKQTLDEDLDFLAMFKRGIFYCAAMVAGLVLYYVILQFSLRYYGVELLDYQGISGMGKLPLSDLFGVIMTAFSSYGALVTEDYCSLAQTGLLKIGYILAYVIFVAMIVTAIVGKKRRIGTVAAIVFLCAAFPLAGNLIVVMCPNSRIRTLMVYSMVILLWAPLLLMESMPPCPAVKKKLTSFSRKSVFAVILLAIFSYSYLAQVNYASQYYANRQMENYMNALVVQVRMTEGFDTEKKWAFIGKISDPLFKNRWLYADVYNDNMDSEHLLNSYSREEWIKYYFGYTVPLAWQSNVAELQKMEEVQNMPCWPNEGSIKVIGDYVVIKFQ
jgi:hypothetical protein